MKMKTTIAAISFLLICTSGFGQGIVNFNNTPTTFGDGIDRYVYGPGGSTKLVGQNYAAALYWGTSQDSITSLAVLNATDTSLTSARGLFRVATTANPGTWSGGARTLLGTTPGQTVWMQVRIWDITQFASYDLAKAAGGFTGQSIQYTYTVSPSPTPPPSDLVMWNLRFMVPEPSVLALSLVGLGGLLSVSRRRSR